MEFRGRRGGAPLHRAKVTGQAVNLLHDLHRLGAHLVRVGARVRVRLRLRLRVRVRARVRVRLRVRLSDLVAVVPPRHDARVLGRVVAQPPVSLHKVVHL